MIAVVKKKKEEKKEEEEEHYHITYVAQKWGRGTAGQLNRKASFQKQAREKGTTAGNCQVHIIKSEVLRYDVLRPNARSGLNFQQDLAGQAKIFCVVAKCI